MSQIRVQQSEAAQRFDGAGVLEVVADVNAPGTPPAFTTDRYKYFYGLLLRVFTPLGQGEHTTIRLKFT